MRHTLIIISLFLGTFFTCFLTSWLFSWEWLTNHWARQALLLLLILVELGMGLLLTINYAKKNLTLPHNN
ncbi:hypothetical protein [Flagellimonas sp.]|uniref:hypothetical protein n=1 Tax=Flagellimonas sp. TaxID=2058762 RepID=UPI003F49F2D6